MFNYICRMSLTLIIIAITAVVSFMALNNYDLFYKLQFNAYQAVRRREYYRFFSHAFVHANYMHLLVNLFVLYGFGRIVEAWMGGLSGSNGGFNFALLYLGGVAFASIPAVRRHKDNPSYNAVGASGAVSAVLFSAILFQPLSKIYLLFIPIGIPAFIFGPLYLAYEIYMDKRAGDHVAHDAHYWGAIFGLLYTVTLYPEVITIFIQSIAG